MSEDVEPCKQREEFECPISAEKNPSVEDACNLFPDHTEEVKERTKTLQQTLLRSTSISYPKEEKQWQKYCICN